MTAPLLIIAAGGTGGHMFPAQALAEEMLSRGWRVKLSTDARGARYTGNFPDAVERVVLRSGSFSQGSKLSRLMVPFRVAAGTLGAIFAMRRDKPDCVAGFGGYPALPAMIAAWVLRRPRLIHEQNGVLGRVNQFFAKRVNAVACGIWPTELPKGVEGSDIGNPVRSAVRDRTASPYVAPGDGSMELLVFGGSQGARIMRIVPKALALLPEDLRARLTVSHQARPEDHDDVVAAYADIGVRAEVQDFFGDIPDRMVRAQLVVCRSGASSVADLSVIGRPSILIPLAIAVRGEQHANARGLAEAGGAEVITEDALTPETLSTHIAAFLTDAGKAEKAAAAALSIGKPDAAKSLADLVDKISNGPAT
ncbi:UDP-N-acetylglucosamine--N-acetylmuramyl-(pentapeptide) pyrophosphoryl-undecaprenol N-acetylglucosamine transferase [Halovulum sp. GXIMD14793]